MEAEVFDGSAELSRVTKSNGCLNFQSKERVQTKNDLMILICVNSIFRALLSNVYLRVNLISSIPSWVVYT